MYGDLCIEFVPITFQRSTENISKIDEGLYVNGWSECLRTNGNRWRQVIIVIRYGSKLQAKSSSFQDCVSSDSS